MKNTAGNVAIYGGAFNPPTLAHQQVVQEILKTSYVSQIIISPSGNRLDKDFGILDINRKKMIEKYVEILKNAGLNVSLDTYFLEGKNTGFTTTTSEEKYFREKLGNSPYFIFGTDTAPDMSQWLGNEDAFIEKKLRKIFINRPGYEFDFQGSGFDNYILLDIPDMLDISSSMAREMIRNKQHVKGILHPEIYSQIKQENLYI